MVAKLKSLTATIFVTTRQASSFILLGKSSFHQHQYHRRVAPHFSHFYTSKKLLPSSFFATAVMTAAASSSNNNNISISPPIPRRDESRVVYAGIAPSSNWDSKIPRQSNDSTEKLLDPPVAIPDPYGWIRDDDRTNTEVLEYLQAENNYSMSVTKHLKGLQEELYNEFLSR